MKPGTNELIAGILDTLPECKVVDDSIYDGYGREHLPSFDINTVEGMRAWCNNLPQRFRRETRDLMTIDHGGLAPGFITEDTWKLNPEFEVLVDDVPFVLSAARRVVSEKHLAKRAFNRITHRTSAAKQIINTLGN